MKTVKKLQDSFLRLKVLGLIGVFFSGCQTQPTRISVSDGSQVQRALEQVTFQAPSSLDLQKSVIVDTRPRFQFDLARIPRSFHFRPTDWELFDFQGDELLKKKRELQRRLALKGVDSLSSVVVLGQGLKGHGEEFYAAAVLTALGVSKITVSSFAEFSQALVPGRTVEPLANLPYWDQPMKHNFSCAGKSVTRVIPFARPRSLLGNQGVGVQSILKRADKSKKPIPLKGEGEYFVYGAALNLLKNGRSVCIVKGS